MSTRRRKPGRTLPRPWQPMTQATMQARPDMIERAKTDPAVARVLEESRDIWGNDQYTAIVRRSDNGDVAVLSIRRNDRKPIRDWRHLQRIKNDIAGPHAEAFELYPDEDRLLDTANQYWLWCLPPGVRMPCGFDDRRVSGSADATEMFGAVQRDPDDDTARAEEESHA